MKMMLLAAALVGLAACVGNPKPDTPLTVHQRYETACVGAGEAYGVIAAANNVKPFKATVQAQVLSAKAVIDKRCELAAGGDYPYTATEAVLSELEGSAAILAKIKGQLP